MNSYKLSFNASVTNYNCMVSSLEVTICVCMTIHRVAAQLLLCRLNFIHFVATLAKAFDAEL